MLDVFRGAAAFAARSDYLDFAVTRAEYLEMGSNACRRKFRDWRPVDGDGKGKDPGAGRLGKNKLKGKDEDEDGGPTPKRGVRGKGKMVAGSRRRA